MAAQVRQGCLEHFKVINGPPSYELTLSLYDPKRFLHFHLVRGDGESEKDIGNYKCQIQSATRLEDDEWLLAGQMIISTVGFSACPTRMLATYNTATRTGLLSCDVGDGKRTRSVGAIVVHIRLNNRRSSIRLDTGGK